MAELSCLLWLPPTASSDPRKAMAAEYSNGASDVMRHCVLVLPVCVRAGRETFSTRLLSEPPSRYNSLLTMADEIQLQLMGSGVVESHWLFGVDVSMISTVAISVQLSSHPPATTRCWLYADAAGH